MSDEIEVVTSETEGFENPRVDEVQEQPTETPEPEQEETQETPEPTAEEEEAESSPDPEKDQETEKPKKSGAEKRIGKLTFQMREAQRKEAEAEAKVKELERKLEEVQKPATEEEPQYGDFDDEQDFFKALSSYTAKQMLKEEKEKEAKAEVESAKQEQEQSQSNRKAEEAEEFKSKLDESGSKYDDFDEVVYNEKLQITPEMVEIIKHTENPAEILYALGKQPDKASEIAQLTPTQAAMAIGRMDAPFVEQEPPKKTTKAPAPIKPVSATGSTVRKSPDEMSHDEYRAAREAGQI